MKKTNNWQQIVGKLIMLYRVHLAMSKINKSDHHYITQLSQNTKIIAKCDVTLDFRHGEVKLQVTAVKI
jgi:hypothetical protein